MEGLRAWLRPPRNLLLLFGVVIFLPAATLVSLGVRLLDQDRALARQRQTEMLEGAAERGARALQQDLDGIRRSLAGPPDMLKQLSEGALWVTLRPDRIEAFPRERAPYFPRTASLREAPAEPFRELEALEFGEPPNFEKALALSRALAAVSDAAIRAGALLREARILRAMDRRDEALAAYSALSRIDSISVGGEPAPLVALRARCQVLQEESKKSTLRSEAAAIAAGLRAGAWQLDRETWLYVAGLVGKWLGSEIRPSRDGEALAAGIAWLDESSGGSESGAGTHMIRWDGEPVTILWHVEAGRTTAFIAAPAYLEAHWMADVQAAVKPARAHLAGVGAAPAAGALKAQLSAENTGLPWTLIVEAGGVPEPAEFETRRRNLFAGLAAVLVLVAAAGFFLWRWVNRDLAVARLQSDFVSAVSHEFRTPLTALRQFNDLLAEEDGPTPDKRRRYYEAQTRATDRLHRLVESLLDFARMEAGRRPYRFDPLDAAALAADVAEEFRRDAAAFGFTVACEIDSGAYPVEGDREALTRALWNLLDNAMKYSGDARRIEIRVARADDSVSIAVRDQGIGIPPAEQKRIFQKFVRGSAAKAGGIKGTGLGLAMVRHIVGAHGGNVEVKSAVGQGSEFTITLQGKGAEE